MMWTEDKLRMQWSWATACDVSDLDPNCEPPEIIHFRLMVYSAKQCIHSR